MKNQINLNGSIVRIYRKIRKLFRDPIKYYQDSEKLNIFFNKFTHINFNSIFDDINSKTTTIYDTAQKYKIFYGFNKWKRSFIHNFIEDNNKILFIKINTPDWKIIKHLDLFEDYTLYIWGYSDSERLKSYCEERKIKTIRVEDGFIRSVELGKNHSEPYSLIFERNSLYYDCSKSTKLERIIQKFDFEKDIKYMPYIKGLIKLFIDANVTKYMQPQINANDMLCNIKIKKRILVCGQKEEDNSLKYGGVINFNNIDLLTLAIKENPGCDIYYRSHPDMGSKELQNVTIFNNINIVPIDQPIDETLYNIDHVYTMTSLTGFEALIRGIKVTTIGMPFYSGWGLTDDRIICKRRSRKNIKIDELFCAAYVIYPKYKLCCDNKIASCFATIIKLFIEKQNNIYIMLNEEYIINNIQRISESEWWPVILKNNIIQKFYCGSFKEKINKKYGRIKSKKMVSKFFDSFIHIHYFKRTFYYDVSISLLFIKIFSFDENLLKSFFSYIYKTISNESFIYVAKICIKWLSLSKETIIYIQSLISAIYVIKKDYTMAENSLTEEISISDDNGFNEEIIQHIASIKFSQKKYDDSFKFYCVLLLKSNSIMPNLYEISKIAKLNFDIISSISILNFLQHYNRLWKQDKISYDLLSCYISTDDVFNLLINYVICCNSNPTRLSLMYGGSEILKKFTEHYGNLDYNSILYLLVKDTDKKIQLMQGLLYINKIDESKSLLNNYVPTKNEVVKYIYTKSYILSSLNNYKESKKLLINYINKYNDQLLYSELFRESIISSDYELACKYLSIAKKYDIPIGEMNKRKIYFGMRDIKNAFETFHDTKATNIFSLYFKEKYIQSFKKLCDNHFNKIFICSYFGPGDEIRFASIYNNILDILTKKSQKVYISCDIRLESILQRSFPNAVFIPSKRVRNYLTAMNDNCFDKLPSLELSQYLDNNAWQIAKKCDAVCLSTDLLSEILYDYSLFNGNEYLKSNYELTKMWWNTLYSKFGNKPWIGISWRSSLTSFGRNEHYFTIEQIKNIFDIMGCAFINLQYDECSNELEYINSKYINKLYNFNDLDQYNDFENVAALISCLDAVIAPATTVIELAGALGIKSFLLSNSSELEWRIINKFNKDVWHHSVTHIKGDSYGDKESLVKHLYKELHLFIKNFNYDNKIIKDLTS